MSFFGQGQTQRNNPLLAQLEAAHQRRLSGQRIGLVRGRHLIDWVPTFQEWLGAGREDEALALLLEIIEAAEQIARVDAVPPPPEHTQRAVAIYQRRADESGELAVLERYAAACPFGAGDPMLLGRLRDLRGQ
ncbi:MAG: hypothetical protein HKP61_09690 [Dactylosporangium sp.]|nr:hypothetical protein [Dactylosporangium sp.]NNJ61204.1 hypothetical protein [Dactylosporangium sp.]